MKSLLSKLAPLMLALCAPVQARNAGERIVLGGVGSGVAATAGAAINADGWTATVTIPSVSVGGTYNFAPDSASPKLVFNVARACYNSSQVLTTCNISIYGTAAKRYPYPGTNGTTPVNQETAISGGMTTAVVLSDDILPSDTVTLTAAAGFYTDTHGHSSPALTALAITNNANAATMAAFNSPSGTNGEFFPTGNWVTPAGLRWNNGASFPVEFAAFSKFPRNNGQVSAVKFIASDGTHTVSYVATSMSLSTLLLSTTCTATSGSAILTSCGSLTHFWAGERVTIAPSTVGATAMNLGSEPKINSLGSGSITLSANAGATDTVTVYLGNPIYDYAATFTSADQATLNAGPITIEAIVYPNLGQITLDTAHAYGGSQTTTCTMNVGGVASPTLTSCGSISGFNKFDHVTITGTADANMANNDVYLWSQPSGSSITMDVTPATSTAATVTIAAGTPATAVSPNLKNLNVYNDYGAVYGTLCARVASTGTATATAGVGNLSGGTCSTTYGTASTTYASVFAAASGLATANNTTTGTGHPVTGKTHADACGSTIFLDDNNTVGAGGAASTYIPTLCKTSAIIQGDNGGTLYAPALVTAAASNNDYGFSTIIRDVEFTNTATNKIAIQETDASSSGTAYLGNGPTPRKAHLIVPYGYLLESNSSGCSNFVYRVGWMEYYSSYLNSTSCNDTMTSQASVGNNFSEFGSYVAYSGTSGAYIALNTSIGNIYSGAYMMAMNATGTVYTLPPAGAISAFDKLMNYSAGQIVQFTVGTPGSAFPIIRNNLTFAQVVAECTGTSSVTPCVSIGADEDLFWHVNNLWLYDTFIGTRLNHSYASFGAQPVTKTVNALFTYANNWNIKSDQFLDPSDGAITSPGTYTVSGATGCTGTVDTLTFPTPAAFNGANGVDGPSTANAIAVGGVAQTGTVTISGGTIASSGAVNVSTYAVDGIAAQLGIGYNTTGSVVATVNDAGCPSATITWPTITAVGYNRTGNWRQRFGVGNIGNVAQITSNSTYPPGPTSWYGDYFGLAGNTSGTVGYQGVTNAFLNNAANSATVLSGGAAGSNTGFGWYKPAAANTGFKNRVPSGYAGFPGDIEGTPRKNDGTGCAGAYEC